MLLTAAIERGFTALGAKMVSVNPEGVATHWETLVEAHKAKAKFEELSWRFFHSYPERVEVFKDGPLFACFVKWPQGDIRMTGNVQEI